MPLIRREQRASVPGAEHRMLYVYYVTKHYTFLDLTFFLLLYFIALDGHWQHLQFGFSFSRNSRPFSNLLLPSYDFRLKLKYQTSLFIDLFRLPVLSNFIIPEALRLRM